MNRGIQLRLAGLVLGFALMGLLIVVITLTSQRQAQELRIQLNRVDSESVGLADHFKDGLREVTDKLRAYRAERDPSIWDDFLRASHELDAWVDQQANRLRTAREREVVRQIDAAFEQYLRVAEDLHTNLAAPLNSAAERAAQSSRFVEQARRLSDLGQLLSRAHYESREPLLAHANRTLTELRLLVLGLLGLLFLFGVALAINVYRQMIAPLQVKLVESQALAEQHEKLAALGMLAAGVAHEIRNPLTAIKAALFIHQKNFPPNSPQRGDLQVVEREILRLERIVNQFLQFARPTEPELIAIPADVPLREVDTLLSAELAKSGIQLIREPSPRLIIKVDLAQIQQVLINLVQNAAESTEPPGKVTLRVRAGRKRLGAKEANVVILEVADTGKGIPPEVEKRLFDPFFTTKDSGTGLGLSIAARIVEKHGGALQYQTSPSHGTTFGVVLPQWIS